MPLDQSDNKVLDAGRSGTARSEKYREYSKWAKYLMLVVVAPIIVAIIGNTVSEVIKIKVLSQATDKVDEANDKLEKSVEYLLRAQKQSESSMSAEIEQLKSSIRGAREAQEELKSKIRQADSKAPKDPPLPAASVKQDRGNSNMGPIEHNTDRYGGDMGLLILSSAEKCMAKCGELSECLAWTFVRPNTIQGPQPRCYLKNSVPEASRADCCESGTKRSL